jgi:hypothetical protein
MRNDHPRVHPFHVGWDTDDIALHTGLSKSAVHQLNFQCYLGGDHEAEGFYQTKRFPPVMVLSSIIWRADRVGMTPQEFVAWKNKQCAASTKRLQTLNPDVSKTDLCYQLAELIKEAEILKARVAELEIHESRWRQHVQYLDKLTRNNPRARTTFANHLTQLGVSHELA